MKQIFISGPIYPKQNDFWGFSDDWNLDKLRNQLSDVEPGGEIKVFVNSPGGVVMEGFAMKTELEKYNATVVIQGMAGSISSIISMGGKRIEIAKGSAFMLHNPSGIRAGNQDEMQAGADVLGQMREKLLDAYEERTGLERETLEGMLNNPDRWVFDTEAESLGFADAIYEPEKEFMIDFEKERNLFGEKAVALFTDEYNRRNPTDQYNNVDQTPNNGGPDMAELNKEEIRAEVLQEEKARISAIKEMAHSSQGELAMDMITEGVSTEEATLKFNADLKAKLDEPKAEYTADDIENAKKEAREEALAQLEEDNVPVVNSETPVDEWSQVSQLKAEGKNLEADQLAEKLIKEGK